MAVALARYELLGTTLRAGGTPGRALTAVRQILQAFPSDADERQPAGAPELPIYEFLEQDGRWLVRVNGLGLHLDPDFSTALGVFEWHVVKDALAPRTDLFHMHGAALATPGGDSVVVLAGSSENGKSTLTLALLERGFVPFADDVALIEPATLNVHSLHRAFHTSTDSLAMASAQAGCAVTSASEVPAGYFIPATWAVEPLPVRTVLFLDLHPGASSTAQKLAPADAAAAILAQALNLDQASRVALQASAALTAQAGCYRVVNGVLGESVALVERLTRRSGSAG